MTGRRADRARPGRSMRLSPPTLGRTEQDRQNLGRRGSGRETATGVLRVCGSTAHERCYPAPVEYG